jgi:hypothetical protein
MSGVFAADSLRVEDNDRALMAPKLATKASAIAGGASPPEMLVVRARLAQIGGLETSWAAAAANAILEIELALGAGEPEGGRLIDHQLRVFEAHELGLLATWQTPRRGDLRAARDYRALIDAFVYHCNEFNRSCHPISVSFAQ